MRYRLILGLVTALAFASANAALGEGVSSINTDYTILSSNHSNDVHTVSSAHVIKPTQTKQDAYTVYSFVTKDGTMVKEYISQDKVFAIKWKGSKIPNLHQLYANYFDTYINNKTHNVGMSQKVVSTNEFSARTSGIAGAYSGYAVLNSQMPSGITISDLK